MKSSGKTWFLAALSSLVGWSAVGQVTNIMEGDTVGNTLAAINSNFQQLAVTNFYLNIFPEQISAAGTNPAAREVLTFSTPNITVDSWAFDTASDEYVSFPVVFPREWDEGEITVKISCVLNTGTMTEGNSVWWGISGLSFDSGDAIDQAFGGETTASASIVAGQTNGSMLVSSASFSITMSGNSTDGNYNQIRIRRVTAIDNFDDDAHLTGVHIEGTYIPAATPQF